MKNEYWTFNIDAGDITNAIIKNAEWFVISRGYSELAKIGTEYVIKNHDKYDYLIYPICSCFRHFIEIQLKGLLKELEFLSIEEIHYKKDHNIKKLLNIFETQYRNSVGSDFDEEISTLILEFYSIDPKNQIFRYSEDRSGNRLDDQVTHIGYKNLFDTILKISSYLESIEGQIDAIKENMQENIYYNQCNGN